MNDNFEILNQVEWKPDDDLKSGVPWTTDKKYPGGHFYYDCQDNLIEVLTGILGRPNPREPESQSNWGGQGEYFKSVERDIIGIALVPKELLREHQITEYHTDPESQIKIKTEGKKRLAKGFSYHKNPPIVTRSSTATLFKIQSGHNRTEDFQNTFPNELMLVIIVGDPKIHKKANCKLADVRSRLRANPQSRTRNTTIGDMTLAIKEALDADIFIHDTDTGEPHNPDGKKLTDLGKDDDEWKAIFAYICGDSIHPSTRTKVYNSVTGNKTTRKKPVTNQTIARDLHLYGWWDGLIRDNGKIQQDYKRVSWHEHIDTANGALIIAKEVAANHFDTAMYGLITKCFSDHAWVNYLRQEGINKVFLHANLGLKIDSEKSLKTAQKAVIKNCLQYNKIARQLGVLEIKKVILPRQQENMNSQLIDIEEEEKKEENRNE